MSVITNINGVPLFSTKHEALSWTIDKELTGYHTHQHGGQTGYMGGSSHSDAVLAIGLNNLNLKRDLWVFKANVPGAPVVGPPVAAPPVLGPPVIGPPVLGPPVVGPPVSTPPVVGPPVAGPPVAAPQSSTGGY